MFLCLVRPSCTSSRQSQISLHFLELYVWNQLLSILLSLDTCVLKWHHFLSLQLLTPEGLGVTQKRFSEHPSSPLKGCQPLFSRKEAKCDSHAALPLAVFHPSCRKVCLLPGRALRNVTVALWSPQLAQILPTEENFLLCFRQHVGSSTEFMEVRPRRCLLSCTSGPAFLSCSEPGPPNAWEWSLEDAKPLLSSSATQNVIHGPGASMSPPPGCLLEIQSPWPTESESTF